MFSQSAPTRVKRARPIGVGRSSAKRRKTAPTVSRGNIRPRYLQGSSKVRKVMRYYTNFQLNPATGGAPGLKIFRANGVYDPEQATGGHQARGFDQYIQMYDQFTVVKATCKVYFDNNAEASGMLGVIHVRDSAIPTLSQTDVMEYGLKSVVQLGSNPGRNHGSTSLGVDIAKFLGVKDIVDGREFAGSLSGDPEEEVYFHVSCFPMNTGDAAVVNCAIEIEYDVIFHEPKNPTES